MSKVIQVAFHKQQGANELYITVGVPKRLYIRQMTPGENRVVWATATKWKEGYEADTPLKAGITVKVISGLKKNRIEHFEESMEADETGLVSAEKKEFFMSEQLQNASKSYAKQLALKTYDSWAKWLLNETSRYGYDGYPENWLHFGTDELEKQTIADLNILGRPFYVEETKWKHAVCGKVWRVVEIKDSQNNTVELCGIAY